MLTTIIENRPLTAAVWSMTLRCTEGSGITRPGQFVQVALPGRYLRRPISVCDWTDNTIRLVYKVVGEGTDQMAHMTAGEEVDILTGLGNGFDPDKLGEHPLLCGGGVGLPPLLGLAKALKAQGKSPAVACGFGTAGEVFLKEDFEALGVPFLLATMDGSAGVKGLITAVIETAEYDSLAACGPMPMMKAIDGIIDVPALYSFEERMGCGFGACMGCTIQTKAGHKRVCKDGPVFDREVVLW